MNPTNQKTKRSIADTWLRLNCESRIIPFEKSGGAGLAETVIFVFGLIVTVGVSLVFGLILMALSAIILVVRIGGGKKICPTCESENIVPSNSPAAQKMNQKPVRARS